MSAMVFVACRVGHCRIQWN